MKKQFYAVSTKYFDSGAVKANLYTVVAETKPENEIVENKMCDHYIDYFNTYAEALEYYKNSQLA